MCLCIFLLIIFVFADGARLRYDDGTYIEEQCQCVPSHLCADNDVAVNGHGLLDIRIDNDRCPNYFDVCCDNPIQDPPRNSQGAKIAQACGYQTPISMNARITSQSDNVEFGEFPWTLAILYNDFSSKHANIYLCGGSLIHPEVALTAAHCIYGLAATHITVRAGEWNTRNQDEILPHQDKSIKELIIHPRYTPESLKNDIALLILTEPVIIVENVGLICLPPPDMRFIEGRCIATGWGKNAFKKGKHSTVLKKVDLPLVPRKQCISELRNTRLGKFYSLHKSFICAGGEKEKDTCKGDGGGPLACPISEGSERYFQIGIVSWGIGCGESNTPGVYVNVPLFSRWIDEELSKRHLDTEVYKY